MSNQGLPFTAPPAVDVTASSAAVGRAIAPRTNAALQLADSLVGLNKNLLGVASQVTTEDQAVQRATAKKLALQTGGKALAEAVRDGTLTPTQNPFFIQDYNQESAYVRTQAAVSQLGVDSQQWAEKNDPAAFQARYSQELGKIGNAIGTDDDAAQGFNAAAAPAQQQAFAANSAEVSATIQKDRMANLSTIAVENLTAVQRLHAGAASPQQLIDSLAPAKEHFMGTGGTEAEWTKVVYNAFTSAAYNQKDPDLLDKLPQYIKDQPGLADQMANDKYHILQEVHSVDRQKAQDVRDQITLQGQQVFTDAYKKYGSGLISGQVTFAQLAKDNPTVSPLGIAAALNTAQAAVADNQSLHIAAQRSLELDGEGAKYLLDLHARASTQGITPELNAEVGSLVHSGKISLQDGSQIINQGIETTRSLNQGNPMFPDKGKGTRVAAQALAATLVPYDNLRKATDAEAQQTINWLNQSARVNGNVQAGPDVAGYVKALMANASAQWLATNPGDFPGARKAAQQALGDWSANNAERYAKPATKGTSK